MSPTPRPHVAEHACRDSISLQARTRIRFAADGWPIRHAFDEWLERTDPSSVDGPLIAWPTLLLTSLNRAERFASTLGLAAPDPNRPDWFSIGGVELRTMDIEACQSTPTRTRTLMELSPKRLGCLAAGNGRWYTTYSGRTFLYLALKEILRTVNRGAAMAGSALPVTTLLEDIAEVSRRRNQPAVLGSVLATSDGVGEAIKPHLSGGSEISVIAEVQHLRHLNTHQDGHHWMNFFEDYLIPQIELRFLLAGVSNIVPYSCWRESWRFRRFRDENDEEI